jgi:hypothetical protein
LLDFEPNELMYEISALLTVFLNAKTCQFLVLQIIIFKSIT